MGRDPKRRLVSRASHTSSLPPVKQEKLSDAQQRISKGEGSPFKVCGLTCPPLGKQA